MAKVWTTADIKKLLLLRDDACERAMVVLLARQTADEQATGDTRHWNSRGFSAFHAKTGTMLGKYARNGGKFGPVWMAKARKIALVHAGQLASVANGGE